MQTDKIENRDGIFNKLKKLFSNDVIIRNIGGKKINVLDVEHTQYGNDKNSLRDRFNRLRSNSYNLHNRDMAMSYQSARLELFRDYDSMDMDPILSSALDVYADEMLTRNEMGQILKISSDDEEIKEILENLFYDILNVEFNLWSWCRNMVKYGDFFLLLEISPEYGIHRVHPLSAYEVTRVEGYDLSNKSAVKFQHDGPSGGQEYENFEMCHMRLLGDSNFLPYGKSMLEGGRRVWKQLSLMEDAMMINRIMRAPERRVFKIDIGNIPPSEVDSYMDRLISKIKKVPYIDERTGDYNLRFNLMNMVDDFYLPVRGGDSGTSIDTLSGMEFTGTEDIEYLRNKLMSALKIPKAFLGYDESMSGKSTLAMEDIRFAKTICRLQRFVVSELAKLATIHLYVQGFEDASLVNFNLELTNPSSILEQEKLTIWNQKVDLAKSITDAGALNTEWVFKNVFNFSENEIQNIRDGIVEDAKEKWRLKQIEDEGNDPAESKQKIDDSGSPQDMESDTAEEPSTPDAGGEPPPPLQEVQKKTKGRKIPDQTGIKKSSDYPFGENPLGKYEKEGSRSNHSKHEYRKLKLSILEKESEEIPKQRMTVTKKELENIKSKIQKDKKGKRIILENLISSDSELLKELKSDKSMLDENNIIEKL